MMWLTYVCTGQLSEEQSVRAAKIFESWRGTGKGRDGLDAWAILLLMAGCVLLPSVACSLSVMPSLAVVTPFDSPSPYA